MTTKEEVLQWPNIHYFSVKKMMDNNSYYKGKLYKNSYYIGISCICYSYELEGEHIKYKFK